LTLAAGHFRAFQLEALAAYEEAVARGDDATVVASQREVVNQACGLFKCAWHVRNNAEQYNRCCENLARLCDGYTAPSAALLAVVIPRRTRALALEAYGLRQQSPLPSTPRGPLLTPNRQHHFTDPPASPASALRAPVGRRAEDELRSLRRRYGSPCRE
ncbi:hypothetical protein KEM55_002856, partial [Ascosphaera atra]